MLYINIIPFAVCIIVHFPLPLSNRAASAEDPAVLLPHLVCSAILPSVF